nr:hypothetical protein [Tanacetum cinerariifolium]
MTAIFLDMVEDFMEVFMDNFSVFDLDVSCATEYDILTGLIRRFGFPRSESLSDSSPIESQLSSKQDAKPRFIRWVLLLKGFDIEINDKKRVENLAADHLSRLENLNLEIFTEEEIIDEFPKEHILMLKAKPNDDESWYADYVNCIVEKIVPPRWTPKKRRRFFSQVKNYFWDEPYACRLCPNNIIRRCIAGNEILEILAHYHFGPTGRHHSASITGRKETYHQEVRCLKQYLVGYNLKDWSEKLNDALWAFRTANKTPTGCTPFRLVYEKACHLLVKIKHKAYWALKQCNMDLAAAAKNRFMKLNELMELRDEHTRTPESIRKELRNGMTLG